MVRAGFSTSSLTWAIIETAIKISMGSYRETAPSWRAFAKTANLRDFKPAKLIRVVWGQGFEKVGEGGELKHGALEEEVYSVQLETLGQIFGLTRKMVINDDLQVFADTAAALGRAAARAVSDELYKILLLNKDPRRR